MRDYGFLTEPVIDNLYAVPNEESLLDAQTINTIFPSSSWNHEEASAPFLRNTEMVWRTREKYICPLKAQKFMLEQLSPMLRRERVEVAHLTAMQQDYSLIIDCTNNTLVRPGEGEYFEAVAMFIYNVVKPLPFGALTYIDGPLFSIYPFHNGTISLSHVVHSIIHSSVIPIDPKEIQEGTEPRRQAELHARLYWPDFLEHLSFSRTVYSAKSKQANASAYRAPLFKRANNMLSCFTGKIQGIYLIEVKVREVLSGL